MTLRQRYRLYRSRARKYRQKARHYSRAATRNRQKARRTLERIQANKGPDAAVRWALAQVGTVEQPNGSNWGPKISDWIKASGYSYGVPWCQCFVNAAAVKGGARQLKTGYTPYVLAGKDGYRRIHPGEATRGDFVFFKWPGVSNDSCDHVGILTGPPRNGLVQSVEGNTSPGNAGSQNNGQGVYLRSRPTSVVAGYVRPPYRKR